MSGLMRAVVKSRPGVGAELIRVPMPAPRAHDVLIQIKAASICGSDIPIYDWSDPWTRNTVKPGQIIGHEFCGVIVDRGAQVRRARIGEFVTAEGHLNCGRCPRCRSGEGHLCPNQSLIGFDSPGAFAEFITVPESNVISLGDLPLAIAAIQDAFGNAVHAASKVHLTNNTVLVTGCGPIGLMVIALARLGGASRVFATEVSKYRRDLAVRVGVDMVINPKEDDVGDLIRREMGEDGGVDILLEMSGNPDALKQGFKMLRNGGEAVLLGLPKEPIEFDFANDLIAKCISVYGITGRIMFQTWNQAARLLRYSRVPLAQIVTHRFLLEEYEGGIELMRAGNCGKVILFMDEESMQRSYAESP